MAGDGGARVPAPGTGRETRRNPARSRRDFFLSVPSEMAAAWRSLRGVPQRTYAELPGAPREVLGRIRPVTVGGGIFSHEEGRWLRKDACSGGVVDSCDVDEREYAIFSRFSGSETLEQIASWASQRYGLTSGEGFELARAVFLRFLARKACRPGNR